MEIIYKLLFLFISAPFVFLLYRYLKRYKTFRWICIVLHGFILTFLTLFIFNRPEWRWTEQINFMREFNLSKPDTAAYRYIRDNYILIDNTGHKELVPDDSQSSGDNAHIIVTDHNKLATLFQLLDANDSLVDLVVVDLDLKSVPFYNNFCNQLTHLYADRKLLLAGDSMACINDASIYGRTTDHTHENYFVSHQIIRDQKISLAYKMYNQEQPESKLWGLILSENKDNVHSAILNGFFPDFRLTSECMLRGEPADCDAETQSNSDSAVSETHTYYHLGDFNNKEERAEFISNLQMRKRSNRSNHIMIGAFSGNGDDIHNSIYGSLHGSTILLNLYYALVAHQHYIPWGYLLLLLTGYTLISYVLVYQGLDKSVINFSKIKIDAEKRKSLSDEARFIRFLYKLLLLPLFYLIEEETFFPLLIILMFAVRNWTGHWINVMSLLIYLAIMKSVFTYARKKITFGKKQQSSGTAG